MAELEIYTDITRAPDDFRLGRNVGHDPRSWAFRARNSFSIEEPQAVEHDLYMPMLDQRVGDCVLYTMGELISWAPHWQALTTEQQRAILADPDQFLEDWYRWTTRNDEFDGAWEPQDTGTSGTSGAKCTMHFGYSKGFVHAFDPAESFGLLNHQPVGFGGWWYSSMDSPDREGIIRVKAGAYRRGGHEWSWVGQDPARGLIKGRNHWSTSYGINGYMWLPYEDAERLLSEDGDVVGLVAPDLPAPEPNEHDLDLKLAGPLRDWAYSRNIWSRFTKAGKAAQAAREWLTAQRL